MPNKSATEISLNAPGGDQLVGLGSNPTFATSDTDGGVPSPSSIAKSGKAAVGAFNGRNLTRLGAAFNAAHLGLADYDPAGIYGEVLAGVAASDLWTGWGAISEEHGTIDASGTLNHLKFAGAPDLLNHHPPDTASAFVPDPTIGNATADAQLGFMVDGPDAGAATNYLYSKKSFPGQQGGTCISANQNPSTVVADSLGDWLAPRFGAWNATV